MFLTYIFCISFDVISIRKKYVRSVSVFEKLSKELD